MLLMLLSIFVRHFFFKKITNTEKFLIIAHLFEFSILTHIEIFARPSPYWEQKKTTNNWTIIFTINYLCNIMHSTIYNIYFIIPNTTCRYNKVMDSCVFLKNKRKKIYSYKQYYYNILFIFKRLSTAQKTNNDIMHKCEIIASFFFSNFISVGTIYIFIVCLRPIPAIWW